MSGVLSTIPALPACRSKPLTPCDPESIRLVGVCQGGCKCCAVREEIEGCRACGAVDRAFAALRLDEKPPGLAADLVTQDEVWPKSTDAKTMLTLNVPVLGLRAEGSGDALVVDFHAFSATARGEPKAPMEQPEPAKLPTLSLKRPEDRERGVELEECCVVA